MNDRDVIRSLETVSSRKAMLGIGLVAAALVAVIGLVVAGFRGEDVPEGADAVTKSVMPSPSR
jgi:hypothetical protein